MNLTLILFLGNEGNIKDVDSILEDMGVELTQQEYTDLLKNVPVDGKCLNSVLAIRRAWAEACLCRLYILMGRETAKQTAQGSV